MQKHHVTDVNIWYGYRRWFSLQVQASLYSCMRLQATYSYPENDSVNTIWIQSKAQLINKLTRSQKFVVLTVQRWTGWYRQTLLRCMLSISIMVGTTAQHHMPLQSHTYQIPAVTSLLYIRGQAYKVHTGCMETGADIKQQQQSRV